MKYGCKETERELAFDTGRVRFVVSKTSGRIGSAAFLDGGSWIELLHPGAFAGDSWDLPVVRFELVDTEPSACVVEVDREDAEWRSETRYTMYPAGYMTVDVAYTALRDGVIPPPLAVGLPLSDTTVLGHAHRIVNLVNEPRNRLAPRALGLDFSIDDRPVTASVNLLLEQVRSGIDHRPPEKQFIERDGHHLLCWSLGTGGRPVSAGFCYSNRWGLSLTALDNGPNPVRGQRIYHWYGRFPRYPSDDLLVEAAEYGCSIFILHMPSFAWISGSEAADEVEMSRVVRKGHELGMKLLFYCVPQLVSRDAPYHGDLAGCRTENLRVWHSLRETQIVFYEEDTSFDADELCLRCPEAFDFIFSTVLSCVRKYVFDGIYVDYAWPTAGLCFDTAHGHDAGCFNFSDYWRMLREWRRELGDDALMIGHGGGLLVSSDMVEGFDACLTGEAQAGLDPVMIGQQFGIAPTLWGMHRRKKEIFRSGRTVCELVREGMTPHVGLGVLGTSVIATFDPAHHRELLPLWQMWRSFPVEKARCYTYLQPGSVEVDNSEVVFTLFVTDDQKMLLILANAGGPYHDANPSVGVTARIDASLLNGDAPMRTWRLSGMSYETFRIAEIEATSSGEIRVPEIGLHEAVGFVLSPDEPPEELKSLVTHLAGRWKRMAEIGERKLEHLRELDVKQQEWAKLPSAGNAKDYNSFMKGRLTE